MVTFHTEETENFSEKDLSLTFYLVGYVFETFYRRLRCFAKNVSLYSHQFLSFLSTGNCVGENDTFPKHKHVDIMHRGALWKINENATFNFEVAGCYFRVATQKLKCY